MERSCVTKVDVKPVLSVVTACAEVVDMAVVILDIDNTIACDAWRVPFIDHSAEFPYAKYNAYHEASVEDEVANRQLFDGVPHEIVIFTARPNIYAEMTKEWLRKNGVNYKLMFMRHEDDHRHSVELKQHMLGLLRCIYDGEIVAAYDDREDVCEMFRRNGVPAHCVKIAEVNYESA